MINNPAGNETIHGISANLYGTKSKTVIKDQLKKSADLVDSEPRTRIPHFA